MTSSTNALFKRLQVPHITVWRILRKTLEMYQYKLKILFKLTEANLAAKYDFSLRVIVQVESELFISYMMEM